MFCYSLKDNVMDLSINVVVLILFVIDLICYVRVLSCAKKLSLLFKTNAVLNTTITVSIEHVMV